MIYRLRKALPLVRKGFAAFAAEIRRGARSSVLAQLLQIQPADKTDDNYAV